MQEETRCSLVNILWEYRDIFAFDPEEMPGNDPAVMEHWLNMDLARNSVIQKKRHIGPERAAVETAEVQMLLGRASLRSANILSGFQTWYL